MILNKEAVLAILNKREVLYDTDIISVLRYYIHLRKGVVVTIARANSEMRCELMMIMFNRAVDWMGTTGHFKVEEDE